MHLFANLATNYKRPSLKKAKNFKNIWPIWMKNWRSKMAFIGSPFFWPFFRPFFLNFVLTKKVTKAKSVRHIVSYSDLRYNSNHRRPILTTTPLKKEENLLIWVYCVLIKLKYYSLHSLHKSNRWLINYQINQMVVFPNSITFFVKRGFNQRDRSELAQGTPFPQCM